LSNVVGTQTAKLREQTLKINDVLMMNKILFMERAVKMQRDL